MQDNTFYHFSSASHNPQHLTGWKVHLSIHPEDVPHASNLVADYAMKEGIGRLKFVRPGSIASFADSADEQSGKMITISHSGESGWNDKLHGIESLLTTNGIRPGPAVQGDRPISGSHYAAYRNDGNRGNDGQYISAAEIRNLPETQRYNPTGAPDIFAGVDVSDVHGVMRPSLHSAPGLSEFHAKISNPDNFQYVQIGPSHAREEVYRTHPDQFTTQDLEKLHSILPGNIEPRIKESTSQPGKKYLYVAAEHDSAAIHAINTEIEKVAGRGIVPASPAATVSPNQAMHAPADAGAGQPVQAPDAVAQKLANMARQTTHTIAFARAHLLDEGRAISQGVVHRVAQAAGLVAFVTKKTFHMLHPTAAGEFAGCEVHAAKKLGHSAVRFGGHEVCAVEKASAATVEHAKAQASQLVSQTDGLLNRAGEAIGNEIWGDGTTQAVNVKTPRIGR